MGSDQSCERNESERPRPQGGQAKGEPDDDQEEVSEEAFDSFLTAILTTPPDTLPPIPDNTEEEE